MSQSAVLITLNARNKKKKLHFEFNLQFADPGFSSLTLLVHSRGGQSFLKNRLPDDNISVFAQNMV